MTLKAISSKGWAHPHIGNLRRKCRDHRGIAASWKQGERKWIGLERRQRAAPRRRPIMQSIAPTCVTRGAVRCSAFGPWFRIQFQPKSHLGLPLTEDGERKGIGQAVSHEVGAAGLCPVWEELAGFFDEAPFVKRLKGV